MNLLRDIKSAFLPGTVSVDETESCGAGNHEWNNERTWTQPVGWFKDDDTTLKFVLGTYAVSECGVCSRRVGNRLVKRETFVVDVEKFNEYEPDGDVFYHA